REEAVVERRPDRRPPPLVEVVERPVVYPGPVMDRHRRSLRRPRLYPEAVRIRAVIAPRAAVTYRTRSGEGDCARSGGEGVIRQKEAILAVLIPSERTGSGGR